MEFVNLLQESALDYRVETIALLRENSHMMETFNKEKYLEIARNQSVAQAITELHHDLHQLEFLTFEGKAGYQPDLWEKIKEIRNFSIELWNMHRSNVGAGGSEPVSLDA